MTVQKNCTFSIALHVAFQCERPAGDTFWGNPLDWQLLLQGKRGSYFWPVANDGSPAWLMSLNLEWWEFPFLSFSALRVMMPFFNLIALSSIGKAFFLDWTKGQPYTSKSKFSYIATCSYRTQSRSSGAVRRMQTTPTSRWNSFGAGAWLGINAKESEEGDWLRWNGLNHETLGSKWKEKTQVGRQMQLRKKI